jgi:nitroreductase/FMN reductase [NAD(P)H]
LLKYVFPFAGMAVGWPSDEPALNPRLPLAATVHLDSFDDANLPEHVAETDRRRAIQKPFAHQRFHSEFKEMLDYSWSEDVTRQYSRLERETFGGYVRNQGFKLE